MSPALTTLVCAALLVAAAGVVVCGMAVILRLGLWIMGPGWGERDDPR